MGKMPWDKKSKLKFYHARRSQAIKHFKALGYSGKEAVKEANKIVGRELRARKKMYAKVNKLTQEIDHKQATGKKTKRLELQRDKLLIKGSERWENFHSAIGYKDPAEAEEDKIRKSSP